jgi:hypothetical protein
MTKKQEMARFRRFIRKQRKAFPGLDADFLAFALALDEALKHGWTPKVERQAARAIRAAIRQYDIRQQKRANQKQAA